MLHGYLNRNKHEEHRYAIADSGPSAINPVLDNSGDPSVSIDGGDLHF